MAKERVSSLRPISLPQLLLLPLYSNCDFFSGGRKKKRREKRLIDGEFGSSLAGRGEGFLPSCIAGRGRGGLMRKTKVALKIIESRSFSCSSHPQG